MPDLRPQVGDTTNLLLKKLVTATQLLAEGGGIFLTEAEANALYLRLDGSNTFAGATLLGSNAAFSLQGSGGQTVDMGSTGGVSFTAAVNQNITLTASGTGFITTPAIVKITNATDSTDQSTGCLVLTGGLAINKRVNQFWSAGTLASGDNNNTVFSASGSGHADTTSRLYAMTLVATLTGTNNMQASRAFWLKTDNGLTSGTLDTSTLLHIEPGITGGGSTTNCNGVFVQPRQRSGAGNWVTFNYFSAATGIYAGTGDMTGAVAGLNVSNIGRVLATTVTGVIVADLTKGSGNATAFKSQVTAGTGKYSIETGTAQLSFGGIITTYNAIATAGTGVAPIRAQANITGQNTNATITSYANPATDADYEVSAQMSVTASTALATTLTVTYTDVANVARTMILPIQGVTGSFVAAGAITGAGASIWESPVMHIRVKASTTITILTSAGTFTGVTYSASGVIKKTS